MHTVLIYLHDTMYEYKQYNNRGEAQERIIGYDSYNKDLHKSWTWICAYLQTDKWGWPHARQQ